MGCVRNGKFYLQNEHTDCRNITMSEEDEEVALVVVVVAFFTRDETRGVPLNTLDRSYEVQADY